MKNFVRELRWRGMLHDITPDTEKFLLSQSVSGYIGFDPSADSLHIVELVMQVENQYDLEIPDEDAETLLTVGDVKQYIEDNS